MARLSHWALRFYRFQRRSRQIATLVAVTTAGIAVLFLSVVLAAIEETAKATHRLFTAIRRGLRYIFIEVPQAITRFARRVAPLALLLAATVLLVYLNPLDPRRSADNAGTATPSPFAATAAAVPAPPHRAVSDKDTDAHHRRALADLDIGAYRDDPKARQILSDALDIRPPKTYADLTAAIAVATANARDLQPAVGSFPLPPDTPKQLLAALTSEDVSLIAHHVLTAATASAPLSTVETRLHSPGLQLRIDVTRKPANRRCFSYVLAVTRRAFVHVLPAVSACLTRGQITLADAP